MEITERQKEILKAIIQEFMSDAHEVGSITLVEKYGMNISSATVRNEMVKLMEQGFLEKSHISSGRYPTDQAIRLYVKDMADSFKLLPVEQALLTQELFKVRFDQDQLVRTILNELVNRTNSAAFVFLNESNRYFGVSALMRYEELKNIEILQRVLDLLEDRDLLKQVFNKYGSDQVSLLIGEESGIPDLEDCALVFTKIYLHQNQVGHMGVIGSRRMNYSKVIPLLQTVRESVENSLKGWR